MDHAFSEQDGMEKEREKEELRQKLQSYDTFNRIDKSRTLEDVKFSLGDDWVNKVISVVNSGDLAYQVWNLLSDEVTAEDTLALSKLLSNENVASANSRSVKMYLIPKIISLSFQSEQLNPDDHLIIQELKNAVSKMLDAVPNGDYDDNQEWYSELDRHDIYDVVRAQLLCGDIDSVERITQSEHKALTPHFIHQLEGLKGKAAHELLTFSYRTEPGVRFRDYPGIEDHETDDLFNLDEEHDDAIETLKNSTSNFVNDDFFSVYTREQVQEVVKQGRDYVEEIVDSITRYRQVRGMIYALDEDERASLVRSLEKVAGSKTGNVRLELLQSLLTHDSSDDVHIPRVLESNRYSLDDLPELLSDETMIELITIMTKSIDKFKFELSMLLTQININLLPLDVIEKIKPITMQSEFKLKPENGSWYICGSGEPRLLNSIEDGAVVAVNGNLLVKFVGKFSAFCTETFTTREGYTFMQGSWYSPVDEASREAIKSAFDNAVGAIELGESEWAFMRAGVHSDGHTIQEIIDKSKKCIDRCMAGDVPTEIRGMPRWEYRENAKEYF